jgi:hypothetical protein
MMDLPVGCRSCTQVQVSLQNGQCTGAQLDAAIISGVGFVAIHSVDPCFVDTDDPIDEIDVGHREGDLLRRSQSGEKTELVIVSLRFTPVQMQGRNQELRALLTLPPFP